MADGGGTPCAEGQGRVAVPERVVGRLQLRRRLRRGSAVAARPRLHDVAPAAAPSSAAPPRTSPQKQRGGSAGAVRRRGVQGKDGSLLERLAKSGHAGGSAGAVKRRAKSAGASRASTARPGSALNDSRGVARTGAHAPRASVPDFTTEGVSAHGVSPRDEHKAWLWLHEQHTTASAVVTRVADSQVLSYMQQSFEFYPRDGRGRTAKWMLMKLGSNPGDIVADQGWVLASELVLRNHDPEPMSMQSFLQQLHLEDRAHALRGLGVTEVEDLAVLDDRTEQEAGMRPVEQRVLSRALAARARDLEFADDARRREHAQAEMERKGTPGAVTQVRPHTAAAMYRTSPVRQQCHVSRAWPSSAASLGVGAEWMEGQRAPPSHRRSKLSARPSTAPLQDSASGLSMEGSSPRQHDPGFAGSRPSSSAGSLGVLSGIAANAVGDGGAWPADTRRFSGGGFALSTREPKIVMQSLSEDFTPLPVAQQSSSLSTGVPKPSLSQVVLSSAAAPVVGTLADGSALRDEQTKPWLDQVATTNSLRRANKARGGVRTQSAFGRVGKKNVGTPLTPVAKTMAATVIHPWKAKRPKPLGRARAGYVWCARADGGYSQMTVAQRQSWLDERIRRGDPVPRQLDPDGRALPTTARDEQSRDLGGGSMAPVAESVMVVPGDLGGSGGQSWQLEETRVGREASRGHIYVSQIMQARGQQQRHRQRHRQRYRQQQSTHCGGKGWVKVYPAVSSTTLGGRSISMNKVSLQNSPGKKAQQAYSGWCGDPRLPLPSPPWYGVP